LLAACNALLDNEERRLDTTVDAARVDRTVPDVLLDQTTEKPDTIQVILDAGDADAPAPISLEVVESFITPNGAQFNTADGGTTITGATTGSHPVIVPVTQPSIKSDDYTVEAVIRAPATVGEFGIMGRVQQNGAGQLLGSAFGGQAKPFLGAMGPADWNPSNDSSGQVYTWNGTARYIMKLQCWGSTIKGKMWEATQPEPDWQVNVLNATYKTGRGVGYYVYNTYTAVLESMRVTVP